MTFSVSEQRMRVDGVTVLWERVMAVVTDRHGGKHSLWRTCAPSLRATSCKRQTRRAIAYGRLKEKEKKSGNKDQERSCASPCAVSRSRSKTARRLVDHLYL